MENKPSKLPTLAECYEDNIELAFKADQFNLLVNAQPKEDWVQLNKYANNSKYIPIGIIETLLQKIFKNHKIEILREGTAFNGVYVVVRLHYFNFITNQWTFHDGIGSVQLQTKQGSSPAQLENINNNAIMMAFPMAKSYAIKDAAEHIGKLFGRDLNRKDVLEFEKDKSINIDSVSNKTEKKRITKYIMDAKSVSELLLVAGTDDLRHELLQRHDLLEVYENKRSELTDKE